MRSANPIWIGSSVRYFSIIGSRIYSAALPHSVRKASSFPIKPLPIVAATPHPCGEKRLSVFALKKEAPPRRRSRKRLLIAYRKGAAFPQRRRQAAKVHCTHGIQRI